MVILLVLVGGADLRLMGFGLSLQLVRYFVCWWCWWIKTKEHPSLKKTILIRNELCSIQLLLTRDGLMPWEYLVAGSGGPLGIALGGAVTSATLCTIVRKYSIVLSRFTLPLPFKHV